MDINKYVTIDISPNGTTKVEAHNFRGVGCASATQQIEIALGGPSGAKRDPKPEFYQEQPCGIDLMHGG